MEETQVSTIISKENVYEEKQSRTGFYMLMFLVGFALIYAITRYVAQISSINGQSMEPTLHQGEYVLIDRMVYHFHQPKIGEVIAVQYGANGVIKRVEGLPGDKLEIKNGDLYRNGKKVIEPYIKEPMKSKFGPITVPKSTVFVLGDNRNESRDSRSFGPVPLNTILGRADVVVYPFSQFESQPFGTGVHN